MVIVFVGLLEAGPGFWKTIPLGRKVLLGQVLSFEPRTGFGSHY